MTEYIIEDRVEGVMTYRYKVEADSEEEAEELYKKGCGESLDSEFEANDSQSLSIGVTVKKE